MHASDGGQTGHTARAALSLGPALVTLAALAGLAAAPASASSAFDCLIEPRRVIEVNGPVEALITAVRVDRGDGVRRGDLLVEFESGLERATAELTRQRAEMTSAVTARQARSDYAQLRYARRLELTQQNFVSRQELDEAEAERRLAAAELAEASDNQRLARVEHQRALEALRLRTLTSPISGIVIERLMHPGEVSELTRKPILRLAEIDTLHVEAILPVTVYRQVVKGDAARVRPEAPVGGELEAKVMVVDSLIDAASGTFGVRLELPNPGRRIPAGLRCRIEFPKIGGAGLGAAPVGLRGDGSARPAVAPTRP